MASHFLAWLRVLILPMLTEARGDPEAPLDDVEITQKFHHMTDSSLELERANRIAALVQGLGSGDGIAALI